MRETAVLEHQLAKAVAGLDALRRQEVDAIVGDSDVMVLRRRDVEQVLRESEERFRIIADYTYDWESWIGADGRPLWINPAVERFTGYPAEDCRKMSDYPLSLIHADDRWQMAEHLREALAGVSGNDVSFRIVHRDGRVIWGSMSWQPIFGTDGVSLGYRSSVCDISQRRRMEEALRASEQLTRAILNSLPAEVAVLDQEGRITAVNKPWLRFAEENGPIDTARVGIGVNYLEICCAAVGRGDPYALAALNGIRDVLAGNKNIFTLEYPCHPPGGHRWFFMQVARPGAEVGGAILTHIDITDRKLAEGQIHQLNRHLQRRVNELQTILDTVPIGLAICDDPEGKRIRGNPANEQLLGVPRGGELSKIGPHPADYRCFHEGRELAVSELPMQRAVHGEKVTGQLLEIKRTDGREVTLYASATPLFDELGKTRGAVGAFLDITERIQAEKQLLQSQKTFAELVERAPFGIYVVDSRFRIVQMNTGSQTGAFRNVRPVLERDLAEVMHILWPEPIAAQIIAIFRHTLETGEPYQSPRFVNPRQDEPIVESYEWELHRMVLADGQYGVICYYFDSTKLREAELELLADLDAMTRLRNLGTLFVSEDNLELVIGKIIEEAMAMTSADCGNIHLLDPERENLRMAAQRGFPPWWVDCWGIVGKGQGSSGTALQRGSRVIVEDIESSPIFTGTPALDIHRQAGVRAIQSTPLVGRSGKPLGMFSTYRKTPGRPDDRTLRLLDLLARQAADMIERKQAEEALRESEERYRGLVEQTVDGIFLADSQGRYLDANPAGAHMLGYTLEEIRKLTIAELLVPEETVRLPSQIANLNRGGVVTSEWQFRRKDGSTFAGEVVGRQLPDGRLLGILRDVSERKAAQEALRQSEERFRVSFANAAIGFAMAAPDGHFLDANAAFCAITGYTVRELNELVFSQLIHPEDQPVNLDLNQRMVAGEIPGFVIENRYISKNGNTVWVRKSVSVVRGGDGKPRWFIALIENITERKQAEECLRESESRLQLALASGQMGSWEWDVRLNRSVWNAKLFELLGLPVQVGQVDPEQFFRLVHPEDVASLHAGLAAVIKDGNSWQSEFRIIRPDGKESWLMGTGRVFRDAQGNPLRMIGVNYDITERKLAEKELQRLNARLKLLAENAAALLRSDKPQEIVETLCRKVLEFLDCHVFFNFLAEERTKRLRLNAWAGIAPEEAAHLEWLNYGEAICGCVARNRQRIIAQDIANTSDLRTGLVKSLGVQAYVCHPLIVQDRFIGTLSFGTRSRPSFTEDEIALMKAVTDQVASAMFRQQTMQELTESRERLRLAADQLRLLNESLEQQVADRTAELRAQSQRLQGILDTAFSAIITADYRGTIQSVNRQTWQMFGYPAEEMVGQNLNLLMPHPYHELHDDYLHRYKQNGKSRTLGTTREVVARRKDGSTFPVLLAISEIPELKIYVGVLLDITRQKELEREVVEIASQEQRRIGAEMHDSVGQELTALSLMATDLADVLGNPNARAEESGEVAETVQRMTQTIGRCRKELRSVIRGLLPVAVDNEGLMAALADLAERTQKENKTNCIFECPDPVVVRDNVTATHFYLIAQEAVHNAVKHARPSRIRISLEAKPSLLTLRVQDDGAGIPALNVLLLGGNGKFKEGAGLRIMQSRAAIIGATLTFEAAKPQGTLVTCILRR